MAFLNKQEGTWGGLSSPVRPGGEAQLASPRAESATGKPHHTSVTSASGPPTRASHGPNSASQGGVAASGVAERRLRGRAKNWGVGASYPPG